MRLSSKTLSNASQTFYYGYLLSEFKFFSDLYIYFCIHSRRLLYIMNTINTDYRKKIHIIIPLFLITIKSLFVP